MSLVEGGYKSMVGRKVNVKVANLGIRGAFFLGNSVC